MRRKFKTYPMSLTWQELGRSFLTTGDCLEIFLIQVDWPQFATALANLLKTQESEVEDGFKETFRVFSKDDKGCIPVEEIKFVLSQVCSEAVRINIIYF